MTDKIPDELLARFSDFLAAKIGLGYPPKRWPDLARGMKAAARDLDCDSAAQCMRQLMLAPLSRERLGIIASHLTVGETYFFREKKSLAALENHLLPELIRDRRQQGQRRLRLWSAGCASGEEAYTLAILLSRLIPDLQDWQIHILATDISSLALQKARRGLYGKWSFRDTPPQIIEQYFTRRDRQFEILPHLKEMVSYAYLNLAEDVYPSLATQTNAMDLILCRNVLMYFSAGQARKVLKNLHRCLVQGGWLIVSLTETSQVRHSPLVAVNFPGATVYHKNSGAKKSESGVACPTLQPAVRLAAPAVKQPDWSATPEPAKAPVLEPRAVPGPGAQETAAIGERPLADRVKEMVLLARNCADLGDLATALSWCEQALAADRLNPAWHYLRAAILQEQEAQAEAARSLQRAIYLDQDFVMAHFALGNLALRKDDARGARRHFEIVLALLEAQPPDEPLPESEGITAGRLKEIVLSTISMRKLGESQAAVK
ncbi:MAG: CheR family methyltransferase [Desulfobaccales bacterium]